MFSDWKPYEPYTWQQARDEHGKPAQHVPTDRNSIVVGEPFATICGVEVTPWAEDMRSGACFAPMCQVCTVVRARMNGWPIDPKKPGANGELAVLARRFEWNDDQIAQVADALDWPTRWVRELVNTTPMGAEETAQ